MEQRLVNLEAAVNEEREAWRAEFRHSRGQNILWLLVAVGAGYAAGR